MAPVTKNGLQDEDKKPVNKELHTTKKPSNIKKSMSPNKKAKKEIQDTNESSDEEGGSMWFEDRKPGDGTPINCFSASYNSPQTSLNMDVTPSDKSWYELVEEEEQGAEEFGETISGSISGSVVLPNIKLEKLEQDIRKSSSDRPSVKEEKTKPTLIKQEGLKKENDVDINTTECLPVEESTSDSAHGNDTYKKASAIKRERESTDEESVASSIDGDAPDPMPASYSVGQKRSRSTDNVIDGGDTQISLKRERNLSTSTTNSSGSQKKEYETDPDILARRQKQIDYGKNTVGYDRYTAQIPRESRTALHPKTPPKHKKYSRRGWDGIVRVWRNQLHVWDPPTAEGSYDAMSDISATVSSKSNTSDDFDEAFPDTLNRDNRVTGSLDDINDDCLDIGSDHMSI